VLQAELVDCGHVSLTGGRSNFALRPLAIAFITPVSKEADVASTRRDADHRARLTGMNDDEWRGFVVPALPFERAADAAAYLGLPAEAATDCEKVKAAYRRMCLRTHPDKNAAHAAAAAEAFRAVTAALHTLTTANFDFARWSAAFTIPPMQSLEDVLLLALRGAHPDEIEAMLRARGDYRPHAQFGIDLTVPWHAGAHHEPSWSLPDQSEFNTTQRLAHGGGGAALVVRAGETAGSLLGRLGADRVLGASAARPWETVGGVGFGVGFGSAAAGAAAAAAARALALRPDLQPGDAAAASEADRFNDLCLEAVRAADAPAASAYAREACRLHPTSAVYAANAAAALLKGGEAMAAAGHALRAVALEPAYAKGHLRAAQAHLAHGSRESVRMAIGEFACALELEPDNAAAKRGRKDALLTWEADFESEDEA
jgi:hypothetical protein